MIVIFLPFVGHSPEGVGPGYIASAPPTCLIVVPSLCLQLWKIFSASLQVVFISSCCVHSCNIGVPVGGGELKVFLAPPSWPYSLSYKFCLFFLIFIFICLFRCVGSQLWHVESSSLTRDQTWTPLGTPSVSYWTTREVPLSRGDLSNKFYLNLLLNFA